jgi:hypothetical protein
MRHGVSESEEHTVDACDVKCRTMKFKWKILQQCNLVACLPHCDKLPLCLNSNTVFISHLLIVISAVKIVWSCIIYRRERACLREDNVVLMDKLGQLWEIQKQQQQHLLVASSEQTPHEQVSAGKIPGSVWFCAFVSHILWTHTFVQET